MPRRQGQAGAPRASQAAAGYQQIHGFAFVQQLMRKGYMLESAALDTFEQLTGHRNGEQQCSYSLLPAPAAVVLTVGIQKVYIRLIRASSGELGQHSDSLCVIAAPPESCTC
jgi:hypothetical protein